MKRDMNLIRAVLIATESLPDDGPSHDISVEGFSEAEVSNHVHLCSEAGFIDAENLSSLGGACWIPSRLT